MCRQCSAYFGRTTTLAVFTGQKDPPLCEDKDGDSKDDEKDEEEDDQVLTFEEFKKKHLEQGGGQVGQRSPDQGAAGSSSAKKTTLTNYASVDCGAKVVEANPEAQVCVCVCYSTWSRREYFQLINTIALYF